VGSEVQTGCHVLASRQPLENTPLKTPTAARDPGRCVWLHEWLFNGGRGVQGWTTGQPPRGYVEGCQANVSAQARRSASSNVEMPIGLRGYVDVVDPGPAGLQQSPVLPVTRDVRA
jgi:hypothetical protein